MKEILGKTVVLCKRCGKAPAIDPENKRMVCLGCLKKLRQSKEKLMERVRQENMQ